MRLKVVYLGLAGLLLLIITAWAAVQNRTSFIETRQAVKDVTVTDNSGSAEADKLTQEEMSGQLKATEAVEEETIEPDALKEEKENLPPATVLSEIAVTQEGENLKVTLSGDGKFQAAVFVVGKDRLVVDLEEVTNRIMTNTIPVEHGLVKRIRIGQHLKPKKSRVVLDLSKPVTHAFHAKGRQVVLSVEPVRKATVQSQMVTINTPAEEVVSKTAPPEPVESTPQDPSIMTTGQGRADEKISLDFQDADLANVLRYLADEGGLDLVIGAGVKGKVTIKLINIPLDQALDIILKKNHLEKIRKGNVLQILPVTKQDTVLQWGRDPFVLPVNKKGNGFDVAFGLNLRLSAIIYGRGQGVAIINNRILRKGDTIEGVQVVEILNDRVMLNDASGRRALRINRSKSGQ